MASLEEIRSARLEKLQALKDAGMNPYPAHTDRDISVEEALEQFDSLTQSGESRVLAGRIMAIRRQGKIIFIDFEDGTARMQALLKKGEPVSARGDSTRGGSLTEETFELFEKNFDIGDFVEIRGTLFLTKKEEKTVLAEEVKMLSKSLLPLPEKWSGLQDIETRFRERELDLIADKSVKERFMVRSKMISAMRRFLDERGFLEVETPIFQAIPGGANARPFVTHHNALDIDLYLRIATEIYLKRLIVGGFDKIYEIGRLFRNEGIDHSHNPEFTTIELYWAYVEKNAFINFLEETMRYVIRESIGGEKVSFQDREINFGGAWPRITFREALMGATGLDIDDLRTTDELVLAVREKGLDVDFSNSVGLGEHYDQLFKKTARAAIKDPTWVLDYPKELKPLAKKSESDPNKSASVQLIVEGEEIINAYYHELNDPLDQRERFMEQEKLREEGSEDAQHIDEQFIKSLEYGMPPTSGVGIGLDRLAMLLTDAPNIKEVILFPTLRPKQD